MDCFDEENASAEETWTWYTKEYYSKNPIVKILLNNFFVRIKKCLDRLQPNDRVLEVGCGAGESSSRIFKILNKRNYFEASEYNKKLISILQRKASFALKQESVYQLNRTNNEFECLIALEVLEGVEDYELALNELFRVASKYVIVSVPNEPLWRILNILRGKYLKSLGNTPGHLNHWSSAQIKKLLSKYGRVIKLYTPIPWTIVMVEKTANKQ